MANGKNKYGQYMTPELITDFMVSLSQIKQNSKVLEPSSGQGAFIKSLKNKGITNITSYEIDQSLISKADNTINADFVSEQINTKFNLIIGNPPYIRWKNLEEELKENLQKNKLWSKYCNYLCDYSAIFILKSVELLKEGGELIFITPEYWLNTTHSLNLRNYLIENGYFKEIYHFNETPIFEKANVSTIIFRFIKAKGSTKENINVKKYFSSKKLTKDILYNLKNNTLQPNSEYINIPQFKKDKRWLLVSDSIIKELKKFEGHCRTGDESELYKIGDFCDIGNGLVSGLDKAFQLNSTNLTESENKYLISVVKAKDLSPFFYNNITKYFFVNQIKNEEELKQKCPSIYAHFQIYKKQLNKRYQYNRNIPYWEWVFLRNFKLFNNKDQRIFVPCKERISNKDYFRFALIENNIFPTQDVTAIFKRKTTLESIYYILAFLNSKYVFDWLKYNGIVKGSIVEFSEKPISSIPFRKIDFSKKLDSQLHNNITNLTKTYLKSRDENDLHKLNKEVNKLFI